MSKVSTNISIDAKTKKEAQIMLAELGLDLSTAINIFLKQMLYEGGIPFYITRKSPNIKTLEAIEESKKILQNPEEYKSYTDVDSMMKDILDEI